MRLERSSTWQINQVRPCLFVCLFVCLLVCLFVWIAHSVHLVCGAMALTLMLSSPLLSSPLQMSHEVTSTHQTALGQSSPSPSETTWCVHCDNTPSPAITPPSFHSPPLPFPLQYKLVHFGFTHFSINDFYEVQSMRGVYITTTVADGEYTRVWTVNSVWFCHPPPPIPHPPLHPPHTHTHRRWSHYHDHLQQWWSVAEAPPTY